MLFLSNWNRQIREFFLSIDESIYTFIAKVYDFMIDVITKPIFSYDDFDLLVDRIYILVGIIMLFKLAFSLVTILADPDTVTDSKNKNYQGKLPGRIIITLLLIIGMPFMFEITEDIQSVLLGVDVNNKDAVYQADTSEYDKRKIDSFITRLVNGVLELPETDETPVPGRVEQYCIYEKDSNGDYISVRIPLMEVRGEYNDKKGEYDVAKAILTTATFSKEVSYYSKAYGGKYSGNLAMHFVEVYDPTTCPGSIFNLTKVLSSHDDTHVYDTSNAPIDLSWYTAAMLANSGPVSGQWKLIDIRDNPMILPDTQGRFFAGSLLSSFVYANESPALVDNGDINVKSLNEYVRTLDWDFIYLNIGEGTAKDSAKNASDNTYYYIYHKILSSAAGLMALFLLVSLTIDATIRMLKLIILQVLSPFPIMSYVNEKGSQLFNNWLKQYFSVYAEIFVRLFTIQLTMNMMMFALVRMSESDAGIMYRIVIILGLLLFAKEAPDLIKKVTGIEISPSSGTAFMKNALGKTTGTLTGAAGGFTKGLMQGGLAGAAAGLALGGQKGFQGGPKLFDTSGKGTGKAFGFGAGRDYMGDALANGPGTAGGAIQRRLQRTSSNALGRKANAAADKAESFRNQKGGQYQQSKAAYDKAAAAENQIQEDLAKAQARQQQTQSRIESARAAGDRTLEGELSSDLEAANNDVSDLNINLQRTQADRATYASDHNESVDTYNDYYDEHMSEVDTINKKTGKDANQYGPVRGKSGFNRDKRV